MNAVEVKYDEPTAEQPVAAASSRVGVDIWKCLTYLLKSDLALTDRGELIPDGAGTGSNIVLLVNDVLRRRRTSDLIIGCQMFVQQLSRGTDTAE